MRYKTQGVCAAYIDYEIDDKKHLHNVRFTGGCKGNREAVGKLVEGMHKDKVIETLKGIQCRNGTSCADQLAQALAKQGRK